MLHTRCDPDVTLMCTECFSFGFAVFCEVLLTFNLFLNFYFILFYLFKFRERGREGERAGEKH